jgi:CDP-glycerol glycerophosphotransferase
MKSYDNIKFFSGADYPEINDWLANFDALITDYSSIMYDFMILNHPILYFDYDYDEYNNQVGFAVDYKKYAVGYHVHSQKFFLEALQDAFANDSYKDERNIISEEVSKERTNNCKTVIDKLKKMKIL